MFVDKRNEIENLIKKHLPEYYDELVAIYPDIRQAIQSNVNIDNKVKGLFFRKLANILK